LSLEEPQRELGEPPRGNDFVKLLEYLKDTRGFDFSGYKLSSLMRRVQKRMQQVSVASYSDYIDFLEVHPDEFNPLFNTVLINVTAFFRDPQAWQVLKERILSRILEEKGGTCRSAAGAPAAPRGRRPTRSPSCSPRPWATTSSGGG
jgi:hypothetical protein